MGLDRDPLAAATQPCFHKRLHRGRIAVELQVFRLGPDLAALLTGGTSHVGAVSAGNPDGPRATSSAIALPGHRDDLPAKAAAERISAALGCRCAVIAGIHYDDIEPQEIRDALELCEQLVEALIQEHGDRAAPPP